MTRWQWALALTVVAGATADAQKRMTQRPGYIGIRVNVGGTTPAAGGGAIPGGGAFPGSTPGGEFGPGGGAGFPGGGAEGEFGAGGPGAAQAADFSKSVFTVVPVKGIESRLFYPKDRKSGTNPLHPTAHTPYGETLLYADDVTVQLYPIPGTTLEESITARHKKSVRTLDALLDVTKEALAAGLTDLAVEYSEQLVKEFKNVKPERVSSRVKDAVAVLTDLLPALDADIPADPLADRWRERFRAVGVERSPHYAMIHFGDASYVSLGGVRDRLDMLEQNLKGFYLWHALAGEKLVMPAAKLTVVIADKPSEMNTIREALDGHRIVSDSFYAPAYNIVVLSPERLDEAGRTFDRFVQGLYRSGWNRAELIRGTVPPFDKSHPETMLQQAVDITRASTIALADRRLDDQTVLAAISREGTRQLYAASGLLAPHVRYPEWIEAGSVDVFHKPKGPIVTDISNNVDNGTSPGGGVSPDGGTAEPNLVMSVNLHFGHGAPNYVLHRLYRQMMVRKELNPSPSDMLRHTLTDHYFDAVRSGVDADPPPPRAGGPRELPLVGTRPGFGGPPGFGPPPGFGGPPGMEGGGEEFGAVPPSGVFPPRFPPGGLPGQPLRDPEAEAAALKTRLVAKSQLTAWALTYYLANTKLDKLIEFYAALGRMPRDMALDRDQVLLTFARTFGLMTSDGTAIDEKEFNTFAGNWVGYMSTVNPVAVDVPVTAFTTPDRGLGGEFGGEFGGGAMPID